MESFESPESSTIVHAEYDPDTERLLVTFKHTGSYVYQGVPRTLWDGFASAASKGGYFGSVIRPAFVGIRQ